MVVESVNVIAHWPEHTVGVESVSVIVHWSSEHVAVVEIVSLIVHWPEPTFYSGECHSALARTHCGGGECKCHSALARTHCGGGECKCHSALVTNTRHHVMHCVAFNRAVPRQYMDAAVAGGPGTQ